jgi:hypothetical protein
MQTIRFRQSWGAVAALAATLILGSLACAGPKVEVGDHCAEKDRPSLAEVDHGPFTALLQKYADDKGLVAYARWKASADDMKALDDYRKRKLYPDMMKPRNGVQRRRLRGRGASVDLVIVRAGIRPIGVHEAAEKKAGEYVGGELVWEQWRNERQVDQ